MHAPSRPSTRRLAPIVAILATPLLLGALVGCAPSETPEPTSSPQSLDSWHLAYAACMREEGIDMPDPEDGGTADIIKGDVDEQALEAAADVCVGKLGDRPSPPGGKKTAEDYFEQELEAAQCIRERGFDVPDPILGKGFTPGMDLPDEVVEECMGSFGTVG
ncbi:hypothetical protein [Plantibacter sp. YIM 135347]|uniref:hypothetical protein n=1 Tax=Plantibacter sp. YIM 135347 TaxID=3423919 RepID=UPI003D355D5A